MLRLSNGSGVTVIDGATNNTTTVAAGGANAIAINPITNKIYLPDAYSNNITVIDGTTNAITTIAAQLGLGIAVNPSINEIYVVNRDYFMVVDGITNATNTLVAGGFTNSIAVNLVTNRIYVADPYRSIVSVIGDLTADTTPPVISTNQTPLPNANGWNNTDVTVTFTATDNVSIPTCTVNTVTLTADGAGQVVSTICTDAAGNSATASVTVNIDKTAPVLTMPSLASNYNLGSSVALTFAAGDTLSGLASVSATLNGSPVSSGSTVTLNQLGTNTFTLTATDKAGNTATQTQLFAVIYGEEWQTDEPRHHDDESDGDGESHRKRDGRSHRDR